MANPQLDDYIKKQIAKGVGKDAIKAALIGVGWQESAVTEALAGIGEAGPSSASSAISSPDSSASSAAATGSTSSTASPSSSISFDMQASPAASGVSTGFGAVSASPATASTSSYAAPKRGKPVVAIVLAVLTLGFAGVAGYFWYQNQDLRNTASAGVPVVDTSGLSGKVDALSKEKDALTARVADLVNQLNDANGQLSAFAIPQPGTAEAAITVQGVLGGGGKTPYTVLTNKNILFTIKNSKDVKLIEALKPSLAAPVIVAGVHAVGSRDITVDMVNGVSLNQSAPTSTVSGATSTPPAATSTKK